MKKSFKFIKDGKEYHVEYDDSSNSIDITSIIDEYGDDVLDEFKHNPELIEDIKERITDNSFSLIH